MVIENEKDYSDYIQYMSGAVSFISLLGGFTFAAFTILLTELPNPSSIVSQFTLFILAALFYIFIMSLIPWAQLSIVPLCKNLPTKSKGRDTFNFLLLSSYMGLGTTMVLMPLIWNLTNLASAT